MTLTEPIEAFDDAVKDVFGIVGINPEMAFEIGMIAAAENPEWAWQWIHWYRSRHEWTDRGGIAEVAKRIPPLSPIEDTCEYGEE